MPLVFRVSDVAPPPCAFFAPRGWGVLRVDASGYVEVDERREGGERDEEHHSSSSSKTPATAASLRR